MRDKERQRKREVQERPMRRGREMGREIWREEGDKDGGSVRWEAGREGERGGDGMQVFYIFMNRIALYDVTL